MAMADTPRPGEDPGTLPENEHGTHDPEQDMEVEANPQLESDSSIPEEDDPDIEDTEEQPS